MGFLSPTDQKRTWFVLTVMTIGIIALIHDSIQDRGWVSAAWWGYGLSSVFFLYAAIMRDQLMLRFCLFAVVAGFTELFADAWLVMYTKTLVYPYPEPMLWKSPAYMPFSWTVVLMEVGFIGWLVANRWGLLKASIFLCILGAMLVPLYERWAIGAKWWDYVNCPMIFRVPQYIILAEGLLMLSLPYLFKKVQHATYSMIVVWGVVEGAVMLVACLIAYAVLG